MAEARAASQIPRQLSRLRPTATISVAKAPAAPAPEGGKIPAYSPPITTPKSRIMTQSPRRAAKRSPHVTDTFAGGAISGRSLTATATATA